MFTWSPAVTVTFLGVLSSTYRSGAFTSVTVTSMLSFPSGMGITIVAPP